MTPAASLVFVVETSKLSLERLVAQLGKTPNGHKSIASLLTGICKEADTLSAALTKLASQHVAEIPDRKPKTSLEDAPNLLDQAQRFFAVIEHGFCPLCGGAPKAAKR